MCLIVLKEKIMKKLFYLAVVFVAVLLSGVATDVSAQGVCGHDYFTNYLKNNDSSFVNQILAREAFITNYISNNMGAGGYVVEATNPIAATPYVVPVMVHLVEDPSSPHPIVSYDQVESQINALNHYFNIGSNPIQFCLIKKKPANVPVAQWDSTELGVVRYNLPSQYNTVLSATGANALEGATYPAPYAEVLNIWVVNEIKDTVQACSGVRGYSPLPLIGFNNPNHGFNLDGVVLQARVFGTNDVSLGTGGFPLIPTYASGGCGNDNFFRNEGKIAIHEVGHYLNLWHTFQPSHTNAQLCAGVGANCATDGDFCCDTRPVTVGGTYIFGTPVPTTCGSLPDEVNNFMYYADDRVQDTFSVDQYNRMTAFLVNHRSGIATVANMNKWGLIGSNSSCVPPQLFAEFDVMGNRCAGDTLFFSPSVDTPNNTAVSWSWSVSPMTGVVSTGMNTATPSIVFNTAGLYSVTLSVVDGSSNSKTGSLNVGITNCALNPNYIHNAQWYFGSLVALDFTGTGSGPTINYGPYTHNPASIYAQEAATSYA